MPRKTEQLSKEEFNLNDLERLFAEYGYEKEFRKFRLKFLTDMERTTFKWGMFFSGKEILSAFRAKAAPAFEYEEFRSLAELPF